MFVGLFLSIVIYSGCNQEEILPENVSSSSEQPDETTDVEPKHFELTGVLHKIELTVVNPKAKPPHQYDVSLFIEPKEIPFNLEKIPDDLLVKGESNRIRVPVLNNVSLIDKATIKADKNLSPTGPKNNPFVTLEASKWGKYTVGESVSVGVINTRKEE